MATGSYYSIIAETLKQQMSIVSITQFSDLRSKIQLNKISSDFESNNGIFTCAHPILSTDTNSNIIGTAVFNIHVNKRNMSYGERVKTDLLQFAKSSSKPIHIKYRYVCAEENTEVNLSIRYTDTNFIVEDDDIYFILNSLFGVGELTTIEADILTANVDSKLIIESYIKGTELKKLQLKGDTLFVAEMQRSPFLKTVYINEYKDVLCIFKEHVVSGKPIVSKSKEFSKFELSAMVKSIMETTNTDFDALIFEASDVYESDGSEESLNVILTFCVNINAVNTFEVVRLMKSLANWFNIYKFNRVTAKKLTHLDVI